MIMLSGRFISVVRVAVFVATLLLIHWQHHRLVRRQQQLADTATMLPFVVDVLPEAKSVFGADVASGTLSEIHNSAGQAIGSLAVTSPFADHIVGFSGPTRMLLVFDETGRLLEGRILSSRDTRDHVQKILEDAHFLPSLRGRTVSELISAGGIDAVSGATLTSYAILEAIRWRLMAADAAGASERQPLPVSLRFPDPPRLDDVRLLFADAAKVSRADGFSQLWNVQDARDRPLGTILRSSPAADQVVGYQGPTDSLTGFSPEGQVTGVAVGLSFDNEPYVGYVREDSYFRGLLRGRSLESLAGLEITADRIEGVSGATMTSQSVAQAMAVAAQVHLRELQQRRTMADRPEQDLSAVRPPWLTLRNLSTIGITLSGVVLGLTHLRRRRGLRLLYQCLVIGWLGFANGDMLSQALLLGWAQSGIPWQNALGLVCLSGGALLVPVATGHNVYCAHICPHGALQQLLKNRLPWQLHVSGRIQAWLKWIPPLLLVWVVLIGLMHWPYSAVDIEPFDAWLWRIAGWPTLIVAGCSLVASLFVPMAYCRFGCPTGSLLDHLRRGGRPGFQGRDVLAFLLLLAAAAALAF